MTFEGPKGQMEAAFCGFLSLMAGLSMWGMISSPWAHRPMGSGLDDQIISHVSVHAQGPYLGPYCPFVGCPIFSLLVKDPAFTRTLSRILYMGG